MYRNMRQLDREIHKNFYPQLFYTEIYLLEGGFKEFYTDHPQLCVGTYTPMKDSQFKSEGKEMFQECIIKQSLKFQKQSSFKD